ncbi:peptide ABC transporter substrate-binding protein [Borrelia hermsii]|uniref:Oligopeptide-binding protein oppA n=3 Tax=Borrelia hermsii TaxID=140 RepID=A0AAN1CEW7_BORHE|nr:peptide ABC transporter substrate-binding protein [Borrelia hermsii]AAX16843.1 oligopeptide-binding protein OppA [Borrelia hermsii DAH]AJW73142.1 ABC transporter substrate-binding protein [Borrelia hermsii CC1]AMR75506.1 Oligopeptide-binding protein oppA [Borrelia hermsii]ANA43142.1 ABC transporter substrate-binding protein [Borrelia hermsii HS1]UCP01349.1 peptide ABC transporter substrate-binding protein [Borrelia hermsii]
MKYKILIILSFLIVWLTSCSGDEHKNKITFRVTNEVEPDSLDPQLATSVQSFNIIMNIFSGLTTRETQTGGYKPGLAKSWDISADGLVYTLHLREDLVWSDGVPITAEGIRKSYLRVLNKETASQYVDIVKSAIKNAHDYFEGKIPESELGIKAIDNSTLEITLIAPKPYFLDMLVHQTFIPVPVHVIEKHGRNWTNPENIVTSGAYKLKTRIPNEKIVLEKNDKYYNASNVEIDEVIFYQVQGNTAYNMYVNDELDFLMNVASEYLDEARIRNDYYSHPINRVVYTAFNTTIKPLDNAKVREALTLAIDREALNKITLKGQSKPTRNLTPPFKNYSYDKKLKLFDPQRAKQLMAEAGYPDGAGFPTLKFKTSQRNGMAISAEFLQEQLKKILNINIDIEIEEWNTFLSSRSTGNYQMSYMGWTGDYLDPLTFLESLFTTENQGFGAYGYSNKQYDNLIKQSNFAKDPLQRQEILRQAEAIITEKDFPVAPLSILQSYYLFRHDKWTGWTPNVAEAYLYEEIKYKRENTNNKI